MARCRRLTGLRRTPDNPPRGLIPVAKNQADLSGRIRLPAGPSGSVLAQASGASGWICPRERIRPLGGCEPPKSAKLDLSAARLPLVRSFRSFHDLLLAYILSQSTIWLKNGRVAVWDPSGGHSSAHRRLPSVGGNCRLDRLIEIRSYSQEFTEGSDGPIVDYKAVTLPEIPAGDPR